MDPVSVTAAVLVLTTAIFVGSLLGFATANRRLREALAVSERGLAAAVARSEEMVHAIESAESAQRAADQRQVAAAQAVFQFAKQNRDLAERLATIRLENPEATGDRPRVDIEEQQPLPKKVEAFLDGVQSQEVREELAHQARRLMADEPGLSPDNVYSVIAEGSEEVPW